MPVFSAARKRLLRTAFCYPSHHVLTTIKPRFATLLSQNPFQNRSKNAKNRRMTGGLKKPAKAREKCGAPEKIRTSDLQLRRLPLYPAELRARPLSLA
jgi:hypothetical protein